MNGEKKMSVKDLTKKEIAIKELEKMEVENDLKIEKMEAKLQILKCEQDQIIETLVRLRGAEANVT